MKQLQLQFCLFFALFFCATTALMAQNVGGFSPATPYYNVSRMLAFTNRILGTSYTTVPTSSNGYLTDDFLQPRAWSQPACGSYAACYNHVHKGMDQGTNGQASNLYSPVTGTVTAVGGSSGKICIYNATHNITFIFLHCSTVAVAVGNTIQIGTYVGKAGSVGATAVHVHTELRYGNKTAGSCPCSDPSTDAVYDPLIVVDLFAATSMVNITAPLDGASGLSTSNIAVTWAAVSGASSYRINITTNPGNFDAGATPMFPSGVLVNTNVGTSTSYNFTTASAGTTYYIVVRAFIPSINASIVSHIISISTQGGTSCNPSGYAHNTPDWLAATYDNNTVEVEYYNYSAAPFARIQISDYSNYTINEGFYCSTSNASYTGNTTSGYLYYNTSTACSPYQVNTKSIPLSLPDGTYCVTVRVGNSGSQSEYCQPVCFTVSTTGVNYTEGTKEKGFLFPNPANTFMTVKGNLNMASVAFYGVTGQLIGNILVQGTDLDISALGAGLYYAVAVDSEGVVVGMQKVVVE